jgi:hypothetical protein
MDKTHGGSPHNGLDPDIASLLSIEVPEESIEEGPDFHTLFAEEREEQQKAPELVVDPSKRKFEQVKRLQEEPKPWFQDKDYYKKVLGSEGDVSQRVHDLLGKYMKAQDAEQKSHFRSQLITVFWELGSSIASRAGRDLIIPKRLLLRFGILSPGFLSPEVRDMVSRIVADNKTGEPVYYLDEWLERIAKGQVRPSSTDEVKQKQKDTSQKLVDAAEKKKGQRESEMTLLRGKISVLEEKEALLREQMDVLLRHEENDEYGGLKACFTPSQKAAMGQIQEILRQLSSLDSQIGSCYSGLSGIDEELEALARKSEGIPLDSVVDQKTVVNEYACVRQMAKMCVGRKGNHFPIMLTQFVKPNIQEIATRENVINEMAQVESLDPGLFLRTHKGQTSRIVPNVLLLASYGETGVCWEPFEKFNRSTSRGRIALPLFSKSPRIAVLTAMADLRWQVAKEKAQYYWMEEGITGKYYQWFTERKLRGDVREYFIRDYVLWITKESQGTQKLDRDVRGIFWRLMPFPQEIKDSLKNRGFVYGELYKKDQNIARSDGY